jgi:hypothetical protein
MKLERNLFFLGHRKIVIFFFSTRKRAEGWGICGQGRGLGGRGKRRRVYEDGGVFARCSQTDI